jgi:hypothetical protein
LIAQDVETGFSKYGETKKSKKNGRPYPTAAAMDRSRRHYLYTKKSEFDFCRDSSAETIVEDLAASASTSGGIPPHDFFYLGRWHDVLKSLL